MGSPIIEKVVHLPVINITRSTRGIGKKMIEAGAKFGFLYIDPEGTAFTPEAVDREFEISRQFFASPLSEKEAVTIGDDNRGWSGMHSETLDPARQLRGDFKECFNIGEFVKDRPQQKMPPTFQKHVAELLDFEQRCKKTSLQILRLMAIGLDMEDEDFFVKRHHAPSGCTVRLLHYPALPADSDYNPKVDIRAGAHSDYGSLTLLFQRVGQPGLEILPNPKEKDTWAPVAVLPDGYHSNIYPPILVNFGDLLSYWTNGLLRSTVHRVIFPNESEVRTDGKRGKDRYSIAFFCHPADSTELVAVPSKMVQDRQIEEDDVGYGGGASKARTMTAMEHLKRRLEATYGFRMDKTGEAVQASA